MPAEWLNDEIINFYGAMVMDRAERWEKGLDEQELWFGADELGGSKPGARSRKGKERQPGDPLKVHYFNTFFFAKLESPGYEKAKLSRWTKKVRALFDPLEL